MIKENEADATTAAGHEFDVVLRSQIDRGIDPKIILHGMAASVGSALVRLYSEDAHDLLQELADFADQVIDDEESQRQLN